MSEKLLRLHILANSNSEGDQQLKLGVRDKILQECGSLFKNTSSKEQAQEITQENIQRINQVASDYIKSCGYSYSVKSEITHMNFNTRQYDNMTIPSGDYDALRITIGEGKGKNWWCVMFPPLCFSAAEEDNQVETVLNSDQKNIVENGTEYEYKFKAVEVFNDIVNFMSNNN